MYVPASQLTQKTPEKKKSAILTYCRTYIVHVPPLLTHCAMVQIRQEADMAYNVQGWLLSVIIVVWCDTT